MGDVFKKIEREGRRIDRQLGLRPPRIKELVPPEPLPPPAIPEVGEDVEDIARKKRRRGRKETVLTGELIPVTTKKEKLG